ncbi:hypothetical protein GGR51DRAFT_518173 [Nemania sp. FL0031]|nr:hypothetical protein GGR51DRAFT_518173 [Nemania sp. FL0031]
MRQRVSAKEQNPLYDQLRIPLTFSGRIRCRTCEAFPKNGHVYKRCNWTIDVDRQLQYACSNCTIWGLLCVVDDIILPPRPQTPVSSAPLFKFCDPCRESGTPCDRGLPCDMCARVRKNPDGCIRSPANRTSNRGLIPRETSFGMELYPFLSAAKGGPRGMDDPDKFNETYDHAPDLHIQYLNWVDGGPLPLPEGYDLNNQRNIQLPPPVLDRPLRTLPLPLPPKDIEEEKAPGGTRTAQGERRRRELARGERSIIIPPVDEFGIRGHLITLFNVGENLQRPLSPGPTLMLFDLSTAIELDYEAQLPADHPEHANMDLIVIPPPENPNPTNLPALRTIPYHIPPHAGEPAAYSYLGPWRLDLPFLAKSRL